MHFCSLRELNSVSLSRTLIFIPRKALKEWPAVELSARNTLTLLALASLLHINIASQDSRALFNMRRLQSFNPSQQKTRDSSVNWWRCWARERARSSKNNVGKEREESRRSSVWTSYRKRCCHIKRWALLGRMLSSRRQLPLFRPVWRSRRKPQEAIRHKARLQRGKQKGVASTFHLNHEEEKRKKK